MVWRGPPRPTATLVMLGNFNNLEERKISSLLTLMKLTDGVDQVYDILILTDQKTYTIEKKDSPHFNMLSYLTIWRRVAGAC